MRKRILALALMLCMLLSVLPMTALAAGEVAGGKCGDNATWTLDDTGTLRISGSGSMYNYEANKAPWSTYSAKVQYLDVSGISSIGNYAFYNMDGFINMNLGDSVTSIGSYAFTDCDMLNGITAPRNLTTIGVGAFSYCDMLVQAVLEYSKLTVIEKDAFLNCSNLNAVYLPQTVVSIGDRAFQNCDLSTIQLSEKLETIGAGAFQNNPITAVIIPDSVKTIGASAFADCSKMYQLRLGKGLTSIGKSAFANDKSLGKINFYGNAPSIGDSAFSGVTANAYYTRNTTGWTTSVLKDYGGKLNWARLDYEEVDWGECGDNLKWVLTSDGTLTVYGSGKMDDFKSYGTNEDGILEISTPWGDHKKTIKSVVVEQGVTSVGDHAFMEMPNLTSVTLPDSVTYLGNDAFSDCDKLTSIKFGNGLVSTGGSVFAHCDGLETVVLPATDTEYGNFFFYKCSKLKKVTIPNGLTRIGEIMFEGCSGLTSITLPDSVKVIGGRAFDTCIKLTTVRLPAGLEEIGQSAFANCNALPSIDIPAGVKKIGDSAFSFCTNLRNLKLPDGLREIGSTVFWGSERLTEMTIPAGVYTMRHTFQFADSIKTIRFLGHAPAVASNLFGSITATVYYPSNSVTWTEEKRQDYGGTIKWVGYKSEKPLDAIIAQGTCGDNVNWRLDEDGTLTISGTGPMSNVSYYLGWKKYPNAVKKLVIHEGLTYIASDAFENQTQLADVSLPSTLTIIEGYAFENCTSLKEITIPENVTHIHTAAFLNCTSLEKVEILGTVDSLANYVFANTAITEFYIADGVTYVGNCAFEGTPLETVSIPGGITQMNPEAFKKCTDLKTVYFRGSIPGCYFPLFKDCTPTAYYPADDPTWTDMERNTLGENVRWIPYSNEDTATRIFGADRYQTAFKVADELKSVLGVEKFQNVIVASGTGFADALAGSYLAAQKNAPILLVRGANVNDVKNYIKNNLASGGTVYLLGGVSAVPKTMESGLEGFNVKRLGGANRYDTNLLILQEAGVGNKNIVVCTGLNFADSLSASAVGLPILLVKDGLYPSQKEFLKSVSGNFTIVGGLNAVNYTVEQQLSGYGKVSRLAGNTRYATSTLVAEKFFGLPNGAVLAYAMNFPDGLCGGPLAYNRNMPLILTASGAESVSAQYTQRADIRGGYVLGGTGLIRDAIAKKIFFMNADEVIAVK